MRRISLNIMTHAFLLVTFLQARDLTDFEFVIQIITVYFAVIISIQKSVDAAGMK